MFVASVYGRLGGTPKRIDTKSGKAMVAVSLAVSLPCGDRFETQWVGLLAFGKGAGWLLAHDKGEMLGAVGKVQLNVWRDKNGNEHRDLQLVVDSLVSPRTAAALSENPEGFENGRGGDLF